MNIYSCIASIAIAVIAGGSYLASRAMFYRSHGQWLDRKLHDAISRIDAHQAVIEAINSKSDDTKTRTEQLTEKVTTLQNRIGRA